MVFVKKKEKKKKKIQFWMGILRLYHQIVRWKRNNHKGELEKIMGF